jgi:epoxyqueuosine reductase
MGNRIYGCDDCLAICPWNKYAETASEVKLLAREELKAPALRDLLRLDDPAFRKLFSGSPIKRTGRDRFLRNVLIAVGNSGDSSLVPDVLAVIGDASALVRAMAVWALGKLLSTTEFRMLRERQLQTETDADVRREWEDA